MEKRLFLAFFIILLFFFFWGHLTPKYAPEPPLAQKVTNNEVSIEAPDDAEEPPTEPPSPLNSEIKGLPQTEIGDFIVTYSPKGGYIKSISYKTDTNPLPFYNIGFIDKEKGKDFKVSLGAGRVVFTSSGGGRKEFSLEGDILQIKYTSPPSTPMLLFSNYLQDNMLDQRYQEIFYSQDNIIQRSAPKKTKDNGSVVVEFAGARDRYHCISLLKGEYDIKLEKDKNRLHIYCLSPSFPVQLYIGPQTQKKLEEYGLGSIIYYGFFHSIAGLMVKLLYFFYFLTKNWGLSIIGFAVFIYFVLFPFTAKSTKTMRRMQEIQPEIEELKNKHKDSPQKLQKETMELYRKYKINPLGGCLPLFLQLPIFISLYQVLFRLVDLKGANFLWISDLSLPDSLLKLPFPPPVNYLNLLPILLMIIGLVQQKVTTSAGSSPEQKKMGLFFGVFLGVIFYNFPSGLVLYWLTQNLLTFTYQLRISKNKS